MYSSLGTIEWVNSNCILLIKKLKMLCKWSLNVGFQHSKWQWCNSISKLRLTCQCEDNFRQGVNKVGRRGDPQYKCNEVGNMTWMNPTMQCMLGFQVYEAWTNVCKRHSFVTFNLNECLERNSKYAFKFGMKLMSSSGEPNSVTLMRCTNLGSMNVECWCCYLPTS